MLTDKQERFAQCIALEGMNQSDAYRECYNTENMLEETIWSEASRLANDHKVFTRIQELREQAIAPTILSAIERKKWLTELIEDSREKTENRIKALDILNKMDGEYVQKIEATVDSVNINIDLVDE